MHAFSFFFFLRSVYYLSWEKAQKLLIPKSLRTQSFRFQQFGEPKTFGSISLMNHKLVELETSGTLAFGTQNLWNIGFLNSELLAREVFESSYCNLKLVGSKIVEPQLWKPKAVRAKFCWNSQLLEHFFSHSHHLELGTSRTESFWNSILAEPEAFRSSYCSNLKFLRSKIVEVIFGNSEFLEPIVFKTCVSRNIEKKRWNSKLLTLSKLS